jgi:hypothetical protein
MNTINSIKASPTLQAAPTFTGQSPNAMSQRFRQLSNLTLPKEIKKR